jgi:hypothetical protein
MAPDEDDGGVNVPDLGVRFEAQRAAAEELRRIALQRSREYAALSQRPAVGALLAGERRLVPIRARAVAAHRWFRAATEGASLGAGALRRIGRRPSPDRLAEPASAGDEGCARRGALMVVGAAEPVWLDAVPPPIEVTQVTQRSMRFGTTPHES